jgi:hypothetical protein
MVCLGTLLQLHADIIGLLGMLMLRCVPCTIFSAGSAYIYVFVAGKNVRYIYVTR